MIRYNLYVAAHIAALAGQEKQADRCSAQRMPAIKSAVLLNLSSRLNRFVVTKKDPIGSFLFFTVFSYGISHASWRRLCHRILDQRNLGLR